MAERWDEDANSQIAAVSISFRMKPESPARLGGEYAVFWLASARAHNMLGGLAYNALDQATTVGFYVNVGDNFCDVTQPIPFDVWSELRLSLRYDTRELQLFVNGRSAIPDCAFTGRSPNSNTGGARSSV